MTMMAEMSVIEPKAKECQKLPAKLPKPRRGKEKIPVSEGACPRQHLDFTLLASRTVRPHVCTAISHPICGPLLWSLGMDNQRNKQTKKQKPGKQKLSVMHLRWNNNVNS